MTSPCRAPSPASECPPVSGPASPSSGCAPVSGSASRSRAGRQPASLGTGVTSALLAGCVTLLAGCAALVQEPEVDVVGVDLLTLGLTSGTVRLVLEVENPNGYDLTVERHRYRLEIAEGPTEWTTLAEGTDTTEVRLPERSVTRVPVEVGFRYRDLGSALLASFREGEARYRLSGDVGVRTPIGGVTVPYRTLGTLEP